MKLSCGQCGQSYDIPISVVMEHDVRFTCRRCKAPVDGTHLRAELRSSARPTDWYVISVDGLVGPQPESMVIAQARAGKLRPEDLVWHEGLDSWSLAGSTPPLAPEAHGRGQWWLRVPKLGDVADALVQMLDRHPNHAPTEDALNRLLQMGRADDSLLRYLERKRRLSADWEGLIELLERRLFRAGDTVARQSLGLELAEICRSKLGDANRALDYMVDAFGTSLVEKVVRPVLVETARVTGRSAEIVGVIKALHEDGQLTPGEAGSRTIAALHAAGERYESAYDALRPYADSAADYQILFDWLGHQKRWDDAVDLLERIAETQVGDAHLGTLTHIARLSISQLGQPERALRAYHSILRFDPYHEAGRAGLRGLLDDPVVGHDAHRTLLQILGQTGDWVACVRVWELFTEQTEDPQRRQEGLFEISRLLFHRIGQPGPAYSCAERALYAAPETADALTKYVELALACHERERCQEVLADLAERGSQLRDRSVRLALKHRFLQEPILPAVARYLVEAEDRLPARLDGVVSAFEQQNDANLLLELLDRAVQLSDNPETSVSLLSRLGECAAVTDGAHAIALGAWKKLTGYASGRTRGWQQIFSAQERVPDALYDEAALQLAYTLDLPIQLRSDALRHIARRMVANGQHDEAVTAWQCLHELRNDDEEAIFGLEHLHRSSEDWRSLAEILQAKLQRSAPGERGPILVEMGLLWSERLDEPHLGRTFLEQAIQGGVDPMLVNERLLALCEHVGDWHGLREHLRNSLSFLEPDEQAPIYVRLSEIEAGQLGLEHEALASIAEGYRTSGDVELFSQKALELWRPGLEWSHISARWTERDRSRGEGGAHALYTALFQTMAGESESALDTLSAYLDGQVSMEWRTQALRLMEWAATSLERWADSAAFAVQQGHRAEDEAAQGYALTRAAWSHERRLGDEHRAFDLLDQALAFSGLHRSWAMVSGLMLAMRLEKWSWIIDGLHVRDFGSIRENAVPAVIVSARAALPHVDVSDEIRAGVYSIMRRHGQYSHADWLGYGLALESLGRLDEAVVAFERTVTPDTQVSALIGGLQGLARLAQAESDVAREKEALSELQRLNALDGAGLLRLSQIHIENDDTDACLLTLGRLMDDALTVCGVALAAVLDRLLANDTAVDLDAQLRLFQYLLSCSPDSRLALSSLSQLEAARDRTVVAFEYLERLKELGDVALDTRIRLAEFASVIEPASERTRLYWAELAAARTDWFAVSGWISACDAAECSDDAFEILDDYIETRPTDVPISAYQRWYEALPAHRRFDGVLMAMQGTACDGVFGEFAEAFVEDEERLDVLLQTWTRVRRTVEETTARREIQRRLVNWSLKAGRQRKAVAQLKAFLEGGDLTADDLQFAAEAWTVLGKHDRAHALWMRLVEMPSIEAEQRQGTQLKIGQAAQCLGESERLTAVSIVRLAVQGPSLGLARSAKRLVAELLSLDGLWEAVIEFTQSQLAESPDAVLSRELIRAAQQVGRFDVAIEASEQFLLHQDDDLEVLRGLDRLFEQLGRFEDALGSLDRQLELVSEDDKAPLLRRRAEFLGLLARPALEVAEAWSAYLNYSSPTKELLDFLVDLELDAGRYDRAYHYALEEVSHLDSSQAIQINAQRQATCLKKLGRLESLKALIEQQLSTEHAEAWNELYRQTLIDLGQTERLIEWLEGFIAAEGQVPQADRLVEAGLAHLEYGGDHDRGRAFLRQAHRSRPGDDALTTRVLKLLEAEGRWSDWYEHAMVRIGNSADLPDLEARVLKVVTTRIENKDILVDYFQSRMERLNSTVRDFEYVQTESLSTSHWQRLCTFVMSIVESRGGEPCEEENIALQYARRAEDVASEYAILSIRGAERTPDEQSRRADLLIDMERPSEAVALLIELGESTQSAAYFLKACRIRQDLLEDVVGAVQVLRFGLAHAPTSSAQVSLWDALCEILKEIGPVDEYARALEGRAGHTENDTDACRFLDEAIECFESLGQETTSLKAIYRTRHERQPSTDILLRLEGLYRDDQDWERVGEVLEMLCGIVSGQPTQSDVQCRYAECLVDKLGRPEEASQWALKAVSASPDHVEALYLLYRLAKATGEPEEIISAGQRYRAALEAEGVLENGRLMEVLRSEARCLEKPLERWSDAVERWLALWEHVHDDEEAIEALYVYYRATDASTQLADVIQAKLDLGMGDAVELLMTLAACLRGIDNNAEVIRCYERVLALAPGHQEAFDAAIEWRVERGEFDVARGYFDERLGLPQMQRSAKAWIKAVEFDVRADAPFDDVFARWCDGHRWCPSSGGLNKAILPLVVSTPDAFRAAGAVIDTIDDEAERLLLQKAWLEVAVASELSWPNAVERAGAVLMQTPEERAALVVYTDGAVNIDDFLVDALQARATQSDSSQRSRLLLRRAKCLFDLGERHLEAIIAVLKLLDEGLAEDLEARILLAQLYRAVSDRRSEEEVVAEIVSRADGLLRDQWTARLIELLSFRGQREDAWVRCKALEEAGQHLVDFDVVERLAQELGEYGSLMNIIRARQTNAEPSARFDWLCRLQRAAVEAGLVRDVLPDWYALIEDPATDADGVALILETAAVAIKADLSMQCVRRFPDDERASDWARFAATQSEDDERGEALRFLFERSPGDSDVAQALLSLDWSEDKGAHFTTLSQHKAHGGRLPKRWFEHASYALANEQLEVAALCIRSGLDDDPRSGLGHRLWIDLLMERADDAVLCAVYEINEGRYLDLTREQALQRALDAAWRHRARSATAERLGMKIIGSAAANAEIRTHVLDREWHLRQRRRLIDAWVQRSLNAPVVEPWVIRRGLMELATLGGTKDDERPLWRKLVEVVPTDRDARRALAYDNVLSDEERLGYLCALISSEVDATLIDEDWRAFADLLQLSSVSPTFALNVLDRVAVRSPDKGTLQSLQIKFAAQSGQHERLIQLQRKRVVDAHAGDRQLHFEALMTQHHEASDTAGFLESLERAHEWAVMITAWMHKEAGRILGEQGDMLGQAASLMHFVDIAEGDERLGAVKRVLSLDISGSSGDVLVRRALTIWLENNPDDVEAIRRLITITETEEGRLDTMYRLACLLESGDTEQLDLLRAIAKRADARLSMLALERALPFEADWLEGRALYFNHSVETGELDGLLDQRRALRMGILPTAERMSALSRHEVVKNNPEALPDWMYEFCVHQLEPSGPVIRMLLMRYEHREDWFSWCQLVHRMAHHTAELNELTSIYEQAARRAEHEVQDEELAFLLYLKAFGSSGSDVRYGPDVDRLAKTTERLTQAVTTWIADVSDEPSARLARSLRLGRWLLKSGDESERARQYFSEVIRIDQGHREALLALLALAQNVPIRQIAYLEQLIRHVSAQDPERHAWRIRLSQLYRVELQDFEAAAHQINLVLKDEPNHLEALDALATTYRQQGNQEALLTALTAYRASVPGDAPSALQFEIAQLYSSLDRIDDAILAWRGLLPSQQYGATAAISLERICRSHGRWGVLIEVLKARAEESTDAARLGLLIQIAHVYMQSLGHETEARSAWRTVLDLEPANEEALWALEGLTEGAIRLSIQWQIADVLPTEDPRRLEMLRIIGRTADGLNASKAWNQVLTLIPQDREAIEAVRRLSDGPLPIDAGILPADAKFTEAARQYHELGDHDEAMRALSVGMEAAPEDVSLYQTAMRLLEARGDWAQALVITRSHLSAESNTDRRASLYLYGSYICERHLKTAGDALQWIADGMEQTGLDHVFGPEAERLAQSTSERETMLDVWSKAPFSTNMERLAGLRRCARWSEASSAGQEKAKAFYIQALEIDDADIPSLNGLINHTGDEPKTQARWLAHLADIEVSPRQRAWALQRWGRLQLDVLNDPTAVVERLRDETMVEGSDVLRELYKRGLRRIGASATLVELLESELAMGEDADESATRLELARLYEAMGRLSDVERVLHRSQAKQALNEKSDNVLAGMYERAGDWTALSSVLERQSERTGGARRLELLRRRAEILEVRLNQEERALVLYEMAATEYPTDIGLLRRLVDLSEPPKTDAYAWRLYELLSANDPERSSLLRRLAESSSMPDRLSALESLVQAEPGTGYETQLDTLYEEVGDWVSLARRLEGVEPPTIGVLKRLARIYRHRLGRVNRADECLRRCLAMDEGDTEALSALFKSLTERRRYEDCVSLAEAYALYSTDAEASVHILHASAGYAARSMGDTARGLKLLCGALKAGLDETMAARSVEGMAVDADVFAYATELWVELGRERATLRRPALLRAAHWSAEHLGDLECALSLIDEVLEHAPNEPELLIQKLSYIHDDVALEVNVLQRLLPLLEGEARAVYCLRLAGITRTMKQFDGVRIQALQQAVTFYGSRTDLVEELIAAFSNQEAWSKAAEVYWSALADGIDEAQTKVYHAALADLYTTRLDDSAALVRVLKAAATLSPEDEEAFERFAANARAAGEQSQLRGFLFDQFRAAQTPDLKRWSLELETFLKEIDDDSQSKLELHQLWKDVLSRDADWEYAQWALMESSERGNIVEAVAVQLAEGVGQLASPERWLSLGQQLLEIEDFSSAEKVFRRAGSAGADAEVVATSIEAALVGQGRTPDLARHRLETGIQQHSATYCRLAVDDFYTSGDMLGVIEAVRAFHRVGQFDEALLSAYAEALSSEGVSDIDVIFEAFNEVQNDSIKESAWGLLEDSVRHSNPSTFVKWAVLGQQFGHPSLSEDELNDLPEGDRLLTLEWLLQKRGALGGQWATLLLGLARTLDAQSFGVSLAHAAASDASTAEDVRLGLFEAAVDGELSSMATILASALLADLPNEEVGNALVRYAEHCLEKEMRIDEARVVVVALRQHHPSSLVERAYGNALRLGRRTEELLEHLLQKAEKTGDEFAEAARLAQSLDRTGDAIKLWQAALDSGEYRSEANRSLLGLYEMNGDWQAQALHLCSLAENSDGRQRRTFLLSAVDAYSRSSEPESSRDVLARLTSEFPESADVARTREAFERKHGTREQLCDALRAGLSIGNSMADEVRRAEELVDLLLNETSEVAEVMQTSMHYLAKAPESFRLRQACFASIERGAEPAAVAENVRTLVALQSSDARVIELVFGIADRLGATADALRVVQHARKAFPALTQLLEREKELSIAVGQWDAVGHMRREDAEAAADADEQFICLTEAGSAYVQHQGAEGLALEVFSEALRLRPEATSLYPLIEQCASKAGRPNAAGALYVELLEAYPDANDLRFRRALQLASSDGDLLELETHYRHLLSHVEPDDGRFSELDERLQAIDASMLLGTLLNLRLGRCLLPEARVKVSKRMVGLPDGVLEPALMVEVLSGLVADEPTDDRMRNKLADALKNEGRWAEYCELLSREEAGYSGLLEVTRIALTQLKQPVAAFEALAAFCERSDEPLALDLETFQGLQAHVEPERLAPYMERWLGQVPQNVEAGACLAVELWCRADKPANAYRTAQSTVDASPENRDLALRLAGVLQARQEHRYAARLLHAQLDDFQGTSIALIRSLVELYLEHTNDLDRGIALLARLAHERAADFTRADGRRLVQLYTSIGAWKKAIELLKSLRADTVSAIESADYWAEEGRLYEEGLGDRPAAFEAYLESWTHAPGHRDVFDAIVQLATSNEQRAKAQTAFEDYLRSDACDDEDFRIRRYIVECAIALDNFEVAERYLTELRGADPETEASTLSQLARIYRATGETEHLVGILRELHGLAPSRDIAREIGHLFSAEASDLDAAAFWLSKAIDDPVVPIEDIIALADIERLRGAWPHWMELAQQVVSITQEASLQKQWLRLMAEVCQSYLDDERQAIHYWRKYLRLEPESIEALQALEALLAARGEKIVSVDILESLIELAPHGGDYHEKLARIYESLDELPRALQVWRQLLEFRPDSRTALMAIYHGGRTEEKVDVRRRLIELLDVHDPFRIVLVAEDATEAFGASHFKLAESRFEELVEIKAHRLAAIDALTTIYSDGDRWLELARLLERVGGAHLDAARLFEERVEDLEAARRNYVRHLEQHPEDPSAFQALDRLYTSGMRWARLAELLKSRARHVESDSERELLLRRAAKIEVEHLDSSDQAFKDLLDAFAVSGDDALGAQLATMAERVDGWSRLIERYSFVAHRQSPGDNRAALFYRLGGWRQYHDGDLLGALNSYQTSLADAPERNDVREDFEAMCLKLGRFSELSGSLEYRLEHATGRALRLGLLERLARLQAGPLNEPESSEKLWREILDSDPNHLMALDQLAAISEGAQRWTNVAELLERRVRVEPSVTVYRKLGEAYLRRLAQPESAVEPLQKAVELEPSLATCRALVRAHVLAGRDERFSEAIDALLNHDIGDGERVELLLTQASVTMRLSGSDETAAGLWLDAALLSPKDVSLSAEMVQCFSEANAWATVISTLVEQAVVAQRQPEATAALASQVLLRAPDTLEEMVDLWLRLTGLSSAGVEVFSAYESWLKRRQAWPDLNDLYVAWRERMPEMSLELDKRRALLPHEDKEVSAALWRSLTDALPNDAEALYGLWSVTKVLDERLLIGQRLVGLLPLDDERRINVLREAANNESDERVQARTWRDVLYARPRDDEAFAALISLAERRADLDGIHRTYQARLDYAETADEKAHLRLAMAQLDARRGRWGDVERHSRASLDFHLSGEANELYETSLLELGKIQPWLEHKRGLIAQLDDESLRLERQLEVLETLMSHAVYANAGFEWALKLRLGRPQDELLLEKLLQLADSTGRWSELLRILQATQVGPDDPVSVTDLSAMGAILHRHLGRPDAAVEYLRKAVDASPRDESLILNLIDALEDAGYTARAAARLDAFLTAKVEDRTLGESWARLARLYAAVEAWVDSRRAWWAHFRLVRPVADTLAAAHHVIAELKDTDGEIRLFELRLDHAESDADELAIRIEFADFLNTVHEQPERALEILAPVTAQLEGPSALKLLAQLRKEREDWDGYLDTMSDLIAQSPPLDAKALWMERARIERSVLEQPLTALESLRSALKLDPKDVDLLRATVDLASAAEAWDVAVHFLTRLARTLESAADKALCFGRLGLLYEQRLEDKNLAQEALEQALALDENSLELRLRMARFCLRASRYKGAIRHLDALLRRAHELDMSEHIELRFSRALCALETSAKGSARQHLLATLELDGRHSGALRRLFALSLAEERWEAAADYGKRFLEVSGEALPAEVRAATLYRLGICAELSGDTETGYHFFNRAIEVDPSHEAARRAMEGQGGNAARMNLRQSLADELSEPPRQAVELDDDDVLDMPRAADIIMTSGLKRPRTMTLPPPLPKNEIGTADSLAAPLQDEAADGETED